MCMGLDGTGADDACSVHVAADGGVYLACVAGTGAGILVKYTSVAGPRPVYRLPSGLTTADDGFVKRLLNPSEFAAVVNVTDRGDVDVLSTFEVPPKSARRLVWYAAWYMDV